MGGAATIIRNLFEFADENVTIIGRESRLEQGMHLVNYKKVAIPLSDKSESILLKIRYFIDSIVISRKEIKKSRITHILGVYRDESSLVLSFVVSLLSRKPLFVYLTDLFAENYLSKKKHLLQRLIFRRSKCIFCLNESMKVHYRQLGYRNVEVILSTIPNILPLDVKVYNGGIFKIAFSGSIVYDRLDLLQMLVEAFGNNPEFQLNFYTTHDEEFFKENSLFASNVRIEYVNNSFMLSKKLQENHLLYFPLTFNEPNNHRSYLQLKTCLGTKSFEYMQTGVPILVHCPSEYYTSEFFKSNRSAVLLNSPRKEDLIQLIGKVKLEYSQFKSFAINAHSQLDDHLSRKNLQKLFELMK
jgi:hypothetical protein